MAGKKDVFAKALKVAGDYFAPNTDEYVKNLDTFFGGTDPNLRRRFYTGTSKDKDFSAFQESRHGTWLTANPEEASDYAMQNDSQSLRMIPGTWSYEPVNSASRVIPTYARTENPYRGELPDFAKVDNYKKAQSDWFDSLRAQGYDSWVPDSRKGEMVVILKDQGTRVKSAIGNAGTFDLTKKNMNKASGGSVREGYGPGGIIDDVVRLAGKVISGEGDEAAQAGIRAYHGSPHDFDKFDMSKIGTGEGAQAYGHGLYFAENEGVARGYRDALQFGPVPAKTTYTPDERARGVLTITGGDIPLAISHLEYGLSEAKTEDKIKSIAETIRILKEAPPQPSGKMYEVNIAADPNTFLDWDKPLSEQPESVRNAIMATKRNLPPNAKDDLGGDYSLLYGPEIKPGQFLNTLEQIGGSPDAGEKLLREQGIPGIKYLDAGSRGKGVAQVQVMYKGKPHGDPIPVHAWNQIDQLTKDYKAKGYDVEVQDLGTRNYVVFDDKLISIIRKYGIAGASAMLGYNLMENLDANQARAATAADMEYNEREKRAAGGEVDDDDVNNALRIAKDVGGGTPVMMEDAKGNKYDAQGNVIPQDNTGPNPQRTEAAPQQNVMFNTAPQNYSQDVQPFIDYAVTPIDRPGMPSEPDLVNVMRIATQVAAQGQPTDDRGQGNFARRRSETVRSLVGASPEGYQSDYKGPFSYNAGDTADFLNTLIDFSPYGALEYAHDIPYEAGRTGDYGTAAVEGGLGALMTTPGMALAGRGIKKGYELAKQFPKLTAGAIGAGAAITGSDEAEAGPARWFSKAVEVARAIPMNKMTGEQALAMLRKGTSPEELRWMGAEDFLSGQKSVSKDDLVAFLEKNRVKPTEIVLGGSNKPTRLENIDIIDIPSEIRDRHPEVYSLSNRVEELRNELVKLRSMPDQSGLDYYDNFRAVSQEFSKTQADLMRAKDAIRKEYVESIGGLGRPTKYENWSTAGGQGYSENLYQIPPKDIYTPFVEQMKKDAWSMNYKEAIAGGFTEERARKFADKFNDLQPHQLATLLEKEDELKNVFEAQKKIESSYYKSPHWQDDQNVFLHTRSQTLESTPPGANRPYKVHNVDETQSDLGQAGREEGFKNPEAEALVEKLRQEAKPLTEKISTEQMRLRDEHYKNLEPFKSEHARFVEDVRSRYRNGEMSLGDANRIKDEHYNQMHNQMEPLIKDYRAKYDAIIVPMQKRLDQIGDEIESAGKKIGRLPLLPYVSTTEGWTDYAIKRELDRALDNDSDYFSWTPGDVHADRYNLEKHISKIHYNPDDGSLTAYDPKGKMVLNESVNDPSDLDEYIGKELAEKMRTEADNRRSIIDEYDIDVDDETGEWSVSLYGEPSYDYNGEPLLFRSKGEAEDYLNEMMANEFANSPVSLSGLDLKVGGEGMRGYYDKVYLKRVQEVIRKATGQKPVIETIEVQTANGPRKQLGIRLTDEMREKARFSDFKKGGRVTGGTSYDSNPTVDTAIALTREY